LREAFERIDPEPVIELLEPMVAERRRQRILEVLAQRLGSVRLVMYAPHAPHNGAAALRSCDAFGIQRVHVIERDHPFWVSNDVAKGAERWVDVLSHANVGDALRTLQGEGFTLIGSHPRGSLAPHELASIPKLALVMGNERDGISAELDGACSAHVRVPMRGFVESLNVSVTAAVLLSHAVTGREGDLPADERRRLYARALTLSLPRALDILAAKGIALPPGERLAP
jgi:tRNA (guanosine-2'-O-)-methyltransferase